MAPRTPTTARTVALPTAAAPDKPYDEEQHDRANGGVDDRGDNSGTKLNTEPRQQPAPNEGTDDPDDEVTNKPKTGPAHDLTGQPAGDHANQQDHKKTFARHVHALRGVQTCPNYPEPFWSRLESYGHVGRPDGIMYLILVIICVHRSSCGAEHCAWVSENVERCDGPL